jgi:hypothetical protein
MAKYAEFKTVDKSRRSSSANIHDQSSLMNVITKPWFVLAIVISCFAILTPKIFIPLFYQLVGYGPIRKDNPHSFDRVPPPSMRANREFARPGPHHHSVPPAAPQSLHQGSGGGKSSMLTFLLPVYAIGIALYMFYTLYKVFSGKKDDEKSASCLNVSDSEFEESMKTAQRFKFKEKQFNNFVWDAKTSEFKMKQNFKNFPRSEESEDEMNNYERYKNLDPDYVAYLKERRRKKREEEERLERARKRDEPAAAPQIINNFKNPSSELPDEIPVTPNIGLTSITNTNVLMNETLERMKFSLNKINLQLLDAEKKGGALEDPDLDALKLQLAQTELQMSKIMNIVNAFSDTVQISEIQVKEKQNLLMNYDDDDENDETDYEVENILAEENPTEYEEQKEVEEVKIRFRGKKTAAGSPNSKKIQKQKKIMIEDEKEEADDVSIEENSQQKGSKANRTAVEPSTATKSKKKKNKKKKNKQN